MSLRSGGSRSRLRTDQGGGGLDRRTVVALAVLSVIVISLFTMKWAAKEARVLTDSDSLCPTDRPVPTVWAVLLDVSDTFSEPQALQVQSELRRIRNSSARFDLFEVYAIDGRGPRVISPVLRLCNPGTGADMSELYQNPSKARKQWKEFDARISSKIIELLRAPDGEASPILEAVQAVAIRTLGMPELDRAEKNLIIVSDLLQYVPGKFSHYNSSPTFAEFRETPYYLQVRADLENVTVRVFYLARSDLGIQGAKHWRFWEEYLSVQGALISDVKRIFGDR